MTILALLWGNPLARIASVAFLVGTLAFSYGFLKGHERANAAYWQEAAKVAKEAAATKERLAKEDAARADIAEIALAESQAHFEAIINDTKATACRLSPGELGQLHNLATGKRGRRG